MLDLLVLIILPIATWVKYCSGEPEKAEERQGPGETIGAMIDRIVGEVAREWVAETTVPEE